VLTVLDGSVPLAADARKSLELASEQSVLVVINKCDLPSRIGNLPSKSQVIQVSALSGEGFDDLRTALRARLLGPGITESPIITNGRHAQGLKRTQVALEATRRAATDGMPDELVLEDLKLAMRELGTITGEFTNEDLYDGIFSRFCLGK
jgi:tRNA modification GTPase